MASPQQGFTQPRAAWRLMLDGQDLADKIAPRLISISLSEKRAEAADELQIELHDHDGMLELPASGARLTFALGWERGTGVTAGLIEKGSFLVDEVGWEGPPDKVTIRARSADFKGTFRTRKTRIFKDRTLGDIIAQIAADNALDPRCHPDLASTQVSVAEQHNKSDMTLLRDLGRRYDAVATVKDGKLLFSPVDADTAPGGGALPTLKVDRTRCSRWSWSRGEREGAQDGAEADWHDADAAQRKKARHGGSKRRKLKRVYSSEGDAKAAATSETARRKRAEGKLSLDFALGDAALACGSKLSATGFKSEIDGKTWRIASVEHKMDGSGGFTSSIELEVAA